MILRSHPSSASRSSAVTNSPFLVNSSSVSLNICRRSSCDSGAFSSGFLMLSGSGESDGDASVSVVSLSPSSASSSALISPPSAVASPVSVSSLDDCGVSGLSGDSVVSVVSVSVSVLSSSASSSVSLSASVSSSRSMPVVGRSS